MRMAAIEFGRAAQGAEAKDMPSRGCEKLSEAQRDCLRLVMRGFKSKEIAHQLGVTEDAINKRLGAAKSALGAHSRFAAARQFAEWEAQQPYHSLVSDFLAVEPAAKAANVTQSFTGSVPTAGQDRIVEVQEQQAPYLADPSPDPTSTAEPAREGGPGDGRNGLWWLQSGPAKAFGLMFMTGAIGALVKAIVGLLGS